MAGGVRKDPAIERLAMMRDNTHLYFRLNPFTVGVGLVTLVAIPTALYYGIQWGHVMMNAPSMAVLMLLFLEDWTEDESTRQASTIVKFYEYNAHMYHPETFVYVLAL